jgi:arginyl-tRNA synthetase
MKQHVKDLITEALFALRKQSILPPEAAPDVHVERARDARHGDFASTVALSLARTARRPPRELAAHIVAALPYSEWVEKVEIAGSGFINFTLTRRALESVVSKILDKGAAYGCSTLGRGEALLIEFVSANPTGPLHIGHGRGAAYGAAVADLLEAVGYKVHREYYINDAGRQMDILAVSVWLRYLSLTGETFDFPSNGYRGDYVREVANALHRTLGAELHRPAAKILENLPPDEPHGGDKEAHIDALIERAKALLGAAAYRRVFDTGLEFILGDIREDLNACGVKYQRWFSERSLMESGAVERAIVRLVSAGLVYEKEGALWFRATDYGDEKDRVLVRQGGQTTYFASDIAYHMDKFERGFMRLIDVWGADHHGYMPRIKAALSAIGADVSRLDVRLVQFATLYRGGEKVQMSTRSGEFVTLRELREEVGKDAARFFYVLRTCEQHLEFDLDLARSESSDNPVYYIQYAHARICSVFKQLKEKGLERDEARGRENLGLLTESHEQALQLRLSRYPEVVESAALNCEPHQLAHYLRELANDFHTYYNSHTFLVGSAPLRDARLNLILATRVVLRNGLVLLGVSAPEAM